MDRPRPTRVKLGSVATRDGDRHRFDRYWVMFWRGRPYRIEVLRVGVHPCDALVVALIASGLSVVEKRRRLVVSIPGASGAAHIPLSTTRSLGDGAFDVRAPTQKLVHAALDGLARVLGPLRYHDPVLGEIVVRSNRS